MTQNTSPDSIVKWTNADPTSIVGASQAQGDSVQAALNKRQRYDFVWANSTERDAQTGMVTGSRGIITSDGTDWIYENSTWRRQFFFLEATATTVSLGSPTTGTSAIGGGTPLTSTAATTDTDFYSLSTSQVTISQPGYYMVNFRGRETSDAVITGQIVISTGSSYSLETSWIAIDQFNSEPVAVATAPFLRVTSSQTVYFFFEHSSGAARTLGSTIQVARLAAD